MAPKKRAEIQKTTEVVVRPKRRRSRSPRELEAEAKQLCVKRPGSSRKRDSGCPWVGLASLQAPPPCSSIIRSLHSHRLGKAPWPSLLQDLQQAFLHSLASYRISHKAAPFDRRATALAWHPTHTSILAVGSKGGDIMLWNLGIKDKPTFIKGATWHPRYNLIVVGRYPDPNFRSCTPYELRTIDVFDGSSGKMMYQLYDPESSGIISLNEFSPVGDTLASAMGYHILIWSREEAGIWG
ncbi:PREDICTED: DNA damage-binding protein 2 isoform X2 [Condylura cristata]|uniref:DNA damage-binding protein 2 isoform X2 n=1 Tax=Condylura cristata TaxID=143302 RepID=UPI00064329B7|nr:PREDICTED: DNA damage-binding protein 2 isoform X2 [Condylura cristata]